MSRSNNRNRESDRHDVVLQPDEPFELDLRESGDGPELLEGSRLRLMTAVYQGIGAASVCWTQAPRGVFMDDRAKQIAEAILEEVELYAQGQRS